MTRRQARLGEIPLEIAVLEGVATYASEEMHSISHIIVEEGYSA